MATSPRSELVIESVTVFAAFPDGWVWSEMSPDSGIITDSATRSFSTVDDAIADFFADKGVDLSVAVDPTEAHYSRPIAAGVEEYHVRRYAFGAPDPMQKVT